MTRTEIDSMPIELDGVSRRTMQLEIEEAALKKKNATVPVKKGSKVSKKSWPS